MGAADCVGFWWPIGEGSHEEVVPAVGVDIGYGHGVTSYTGQRGGQVEGIGCCFERRSGGVGCRSIGELVVELDGDLHDFAPRRLVCGAGIEADVGQASCRINGHVEAAAEHEA